MYQVFLLLGTILEAGTDRARARKGDCDPKEEKDDQMITHMHEGEAQF